MTSPKSPYQSKAFTMDAEIIELEKSIKQKSLWLFIPAGLGLIATVFLAVTITGHFNVLVLLDLILLAGIIISGILITRLNKTGFTIAIILLAIGGAFQIIGLFKGGFSFQTLWQLFLRGYIIWQMVGGIEQWERLQSLKYQQAKQVYEERKRAEAEQQAVLEADQEEQIPQ